jgi:hypothetical protein
VRLESEFLKEAVRAKRNQLAEKNIRVQKLQERV